MPFDDTRDFDDVQRGLVAPLRDGGLVRNAARDVVYDQAGSPSSATPSPPTP